MEAYPYETIRINGRDIALKDILSDAANPQTEFEASTFLFIRQWFSSADVFLQPTSGSTGRPKQITITRAGMIASARMTQQALSLQPGWRALVCLNTAYIAGKMMLVRSFVTGMKVIALEPSGNPFTTLTPDQSIDFSALVPLQIHDIIQSGESSWFNRINTILVGGAAIDRETREMLQPFTCHFYATYGMTETLSHIALMPLNGNQSSDSFRALPGVTLGLDQRGCLTISAPYLQQEIITNDLVERIDEINFRWLGRWDNVINTGGLKVIPEKLEVEIGNIFNRLGLQRNFFIAGVRDNKLGNKIVLLIEHEVKPNVLDELKREMLAKMTRWEVPKDIYTGKSFVFTASGKIDRNATIKHVITGNVI